MGRLTTVDLRNASDTAAVEYEYDLGGIRVEQYDTRPATPVATTYTYLPGDVIRQINNGGVSEWWTTDADGRAASVEKGSNNWTYHYDAAGNLARVNLSASGTPSVQAQYWYGPDGEMLARLPDGAVAR